MSTDRAANIGVLEEFRLEFIDCWRKMPNKAFFLALLGAWFALFHVFGNSNTGVIKSHSLLDWIYLVCKPNTTADRDDTQGLLAPLVVLGLFWWKRKELMAVEFETWLPGVLIVAFGLLVHMFGFRIQQPRISIVGFVTGIYGLMGLAWGPAWLRRSFFPFCLLIFCVPLGNMSQPITFRLRLLVCQIVEVISHYILQIDIVRYGTAIKDPTDHYQYEVAPACSGIRSLMTTIGLAIIYGSVVCRKWWKRGVIFLSAFPLAVAGNTLRMLLILIAAEMGGQEWGNKIHDGWPLGLPTLMPYFLAFVGLLFLGRWLQDEPLPAASVPAPAPSSTSSQTQDSTTDVPTSRALQRPLAG